MVGWLVVAVLIWLVVAFKASHKRICGKEGKERRGELRQFLFITTAQTVSTHNDIANAPPLFCNTIRSSTTIGRKHPSTINIGKELFVSPGTTCRTIYPSKTETLRERGVGVCSEPCCSFCWSMHLLYIRGPVKYYSTEFFHKGLQRYPSVPSLLLQQKRFLRVAGGCP